MVRYLIIPIAEDRRLISNWSDAVIFIALARQTKVFDAFVSRAHAPLFGLLIKGQTLLMETTH